MEAVCLSPSIMSLTRTPAEKILLARICQRASLTAGVCSDTNNELARATAMHLKTVSDLIGRLVEAGLVVTTVDKEQANKRNLMPRQDLLADYPSITDRVSAYYPSITDSPVPDRERKPKRKQRLCPMTSVDITHQRPNCRYASGLTLEKLQRNQPEVFGLLVERFLLPGERPHPSILAERIRKLARIAPVVLSETSSAADPVRLCPISGVDISHQPKHFPYVTAKTLKQLFISNRIKFDKLVDLFGLSDQSEVSMTTQCRLVSIRVRGHILRNTLPI